MPGRRFAFDRIVALGGYDEGLREAVLRMKRPSQDAIALAVGRLLAARCQELLADARPGLIVPIPMHWARRLRAAETALKCWPVAWRKHSAYRRPPRAGPLPPYVAAMAFDAARRRRNVAGGVPGARPAAVKGTRSCWSTTS